MGVLEKESTTCRAGDSFFGPNSSALPSIGWKQIGADGTNQSKIVLPMPVLCSYEIGGYIDGAQLK